MAENWAAVAAEISAALGEVGFIVTLIEPGAETGPDYDPTFGTPVEHEVMGLSDTIRRRDGNGTVTQTVHVITVEAHGIIPQKGWTVNVSGKVHRIEQVLPLSPGGIDLLYDLEVAA